MTAFLSAWWPLLVLGVWGLGFRLYVMGSLYGDPPANYEDLTRSTPEDPKQP